ncbi:MAG: hypothetical protein R6X13_10315 [bacterium]
MTARSRRLVGWLVVLALFVAFVAIVVYKVQHPRIVRAPGETRGPRPFRPGPPDTTAPKPPGA